MRVLAPITTLLFYLWVTVGMTVAVHYCGGEPVSASVLDGLADAAACCCGDQEPMEGCCSTSITTFRLSDDHTAAGEAFSQVQDAGTLFPVSCLAASAPVFRTAGAPTTPTGPPTPSHILHCALLI